MEKKTSFFLCSIFKKESQTSLEQVNNEKHKLPIIVKVWILIFNVGC